MNPQSEIPSDIVQPSSFQKHSPLLNPKIIEVERQPHLQPSQLVAVQATNRTKEDLTKPVHLGNWNYDQCFIVLIDSVKSIKELLIRI